SIGNSFAGLDAALADEAKFGFTLGLGPSVAVAVPGAPTYVNVLLRNVGSEPATYDLQVSPLPSGITATLSQTSITLQPGQAIAGGANGITVALTETGNQLRDVSYYITTKVDQATELTQNATGCLTVRPAFVNVAEVDANPPFTSPGGTVDVSA